MPTEKKKKNVILSFRLSSSEVTTEEKQHTFAPYYRTGFVTTDQATQAEKT